MSDDQLVFRLAIRQRGAKVSLLLHASPCPQEVHLERVRPWLDVIDALRADGVQQDLPLPQIAVMGKALADYLCK